MKTITPWMQTLLEAQTFAMSTGWLVVRQDGQVFSFTDHDRDFIFNLEAAIEAWGYAGIHDLNGTGERTYTRDPGYQQTDVESTAALNVDNMEMQGILSAPSITMDSLRSGLWDYASVFVFYYNWSERDTSYPIVSISRSGSTATVNVASTALLSDDDLVEIFGAAQPEYNVIARIDVTGASTFTYAVTGTPATPATGVLTYQRRAGPIMLRVGKIGQVTIDGGEFHAELRGLTQYYSRTIGQIVSPSCRADLGDSRCTVDLLTGSPNWTVTGTLDSTSADGLTLFDAARTEAGPDDGVTITAITNANPGQVTCSSTVTFPTGLPVTISGVIGMPLLNTTVQVVNPLADHFDLQVDTSDTAVWGTYVSGGVVFPLGETSGYFDAGVITILDGDNAGFSREVKSFVPGQITLWLPFPYAFTGSPLSSYSMHVGCDKAMTTCRDKFGNIVNFRGEPYLPGLDKLVQVGRHT